MEGTTGWRQKTSVEPFGALSSNAVNVGNIFCLRQPSTAQLRGLTVCVGCNYYTKTNQKKLHVSVLFMRSMTAQLCVVKKGHVVLLIVSFPAVLI